MHAGTDAGSKKKTKQKGGGFDVTFLYILGLIVAAGAGFFTAATVGSTGRVSKYEQGYKDGYKDGRGEGRQ